MRLSCPAETYFNPLPRKEGDCLHLSFLTMQANFNPLPRKEGDRKYS